MKFSNNDYNSLKTDISNFLTANNITLKALKDTANKENYSEKRFIWDIFWMSKWSKKDENRQKNYLDTHIETATKKAIKEIMELETTQQ